MADAPFERYAGISDVPRVRSRYEEELIYHALREFAEDVLWRNTFASQWEEAAQVIYPEQRNTFLYGSFNWPGQKKTERQVDGTGMLANARFAAICDSLLTPRNMQWHGLSASNEYLMKDRSLRLWFEHKTRALFRARYAPSANFAASNHSNYLSLGAFGNHGMFTDEYVDAQGRPGLGMRYLGIPLGEMFIRQNHQGLITGFKRWFKLTAEQALGKWGEVAFPATMLPALKAGSQMPFDFLHWVLPRTDYDPKRLDYKGMPWSSCYIAIQAKTLMQEGGYHSFPLAFGRYLQNAGEIYGRGPAQMVLPSLKTLNAQKAVFLKQGHRASDPVLLTNDDGLVDGVSLRPGALNKGGVDAEGREMVKVLPTGNIQINKEMMAEERSIINDAFLVSLFQILTETPQMTATEVIERTNEKGILLAPTMGRQQSEYVGEIVPRELEILMRQHRLDPDPMWRMPRALIEARGEYEIVYTSPLSRAMKAQEAAGFMRTVESVKELVAITGDTSLLHPFAFERAIPAIAEIQAVPETWMASAQEIMKKDKDLAASKQQQAEIQALPAKAAMMKAQATVSKNPQSAPPQGMQPAPQPGVPQQQQAA